MSFVEDQKVYLVHLDVAMEEEVVELLSNEHENVVTAELFEPVLVFVDLLVVLTTYTLYKLRAYLRTCRRGPAPCSAR